MRPMTTWHRLGDKPELFLQVPTVFKLDRWSVAVFHHDGRFRAIGNACNHKGGPLSEGRLHGEFVMCPWHAWEYSVITGKGPEGFDEEQVPVFAVEERAEGVYVETPPVMPRKLISTSPPTCSSRALSPPAPRRAYWCSRPRRWTTSTRAFPRRTRCSSTPSTG